MSSKGSRFIQLANRALSFLFNENLEDLELVGVKPDLAAGQALIHWDKILVVVRPRQHPVATARAGVAAGLFFFFPLFFYGVKQKLLPEGPGLLDQSLRKVELLPEKDPLHLD